MIGAITTDFHIDHLIKVAPADFFPLISMYAIEAFL